jgi:hypothetical protein
MKTLKRFHIGAIIHFAAHGYVGESVQNPRKYFDNNVSKTLALLDTLLDAGVDKIVFSSSCATYGIPRELPLAEDHRGIRSICMARRNCLWKMSSSRRRKKRQRQSRHWSRTLDTRCHLGGRGSEPKDRSGRRRPPAVRGPARADSECATRSVSSGMEPDEIRSAYAWEWHQNRPLSPIAVLPSRKTRDQAAAIHSR